MARKNGFPFENDEFSYDDFITDTDIEENEEQNKPLALLDHIDLVIKIQSLIQNHLDDKEKKIKYQEILNNHLTVCSDILGITTLQALLFSHILNGGRLFNQGELARILNVTRVQFFKYLDDIDVLFNKHLIKKYDSGYHGIDEEEYWVPNDVIQAVREGRAFILPNICGLSKDEFFNHLKRLFKSVIEEGEFSSRKGSTFLLDFGKLLNENFQLEFVNNIHKLSLTRTNLIFLSYLCTLFYTEHKNIFPISRFLSLGSFDIFYKERIDINKLLELKLIEYSGDDFKDKEYIVLTHKALIELLDISETELKSKINSGLINHENIQKKELFYNENDRKQIEQLTELLIEENLIMVRERLKIKRMRTGFSCLFFGSPGTGKTETAYQIARISGRDIMPIDISATKSCWFGESEKIIKDIFMQYHYKVKKANDINLPVPIILLNEADAIITKRKDTSISGPAQTENAIQNIILEELEKFDGIMIATTNLIENIDKAFERRFIYKIEFHKPCIETRQSIWRSLIPELTEEEANKLAEVFDLSGGQIENIARKRTIAGILNGNDPELADLIKICDEETMFKNDIKIGF